MIMMLMMMMENVLERAQNMNCVFMLIVLLTLGRASLATPENPKLSDWRVYAENATYYTPKWADGACTPECTVQCRYAGRSSLPMRIDCTTTDPATSYISLTSNGSQENVTQGSSYRIQGKFKPVHDGVYRCKDSRPETQTNHTCICLRVPASMQEVFECYPSPRIYPNLTPEERRQKQNVTVAEGSKLVLRCPFTKLRTNRRSMSFIQWKYSKFHQFNEDDSALLPCRKFTSKHFTIHNVTAANDGVYTCVVMGDKRASPNSTFHFIVRVKPVPRMASVNVNTSAPMSTLTWLRPRTGQVSLLGYRVNITFKVGHTTSVCSHTVPNSAHSLDLSNLLSQCQQCSPVTEASVSVQALTNLGYGRASEPTSLDDYLTHFRATSWKITLNLVSADGCSRVRCPQGSVSIAALRWELLSALREMLQRTCSCCSVNVLQSALGGVCYSAADQERVNCSVDAGRLGIDVVLRVTVNSAWIDVPQAVFTLFKRRPVIDETSLWPMNVTKVEVERPDADFIIAERISDSNKRIARLCRFQNFI
ncbi:uncharacterized protein LOC135812682 [Sycon ciliatum]|uniref:uncharacterized protein LOC135812682 n=1 Tax=Sycon ciliatum TaxID=27933 RepID=UPI0031F5F4B0